MSDGDKALEKKHQILLQKYKTLRRNHRKLAGVALQLADALEAFIKDEGKPDVEKVLLSCSTIYPGLVKDPTDDEPSTERSEPTESTPEAVSVADGGKEPPEKEYFEGFWSKPKIPRTPLV